MKHKIRTKALSWLLSLALALSLVPGMGLTTYAAIPDNGKYIVYTANGTTATSTEAAIPTGGNVVEITASNVPTNWEDGKTYVITETASVSTRITVTGTANLILTDGNTFTASKGITVADGNTLNIYAQSEGNNAGVLLINSVDDNNSGIGGGTTANDRNAGALIIHGGKIVASGGQYGAGIGGGYMGNGGIVTIYGGAITAAGGRRAAGIGGGEQNESTGGNGGEVTIFGGTVTATGGYNGAGIGGGKKGSGGTVTIHGGTVTATGNTDADGGAGIGAGDDGGSGGAVTIDGGTVTATGSNKMCMGIGGKAKRDMSQIVPPQNGSLTVGSGLKVYGGNSANPTTEISQDEMSKINSSQNTTVYRYMIVSGPLHEHSFTYSVNGDTITATCGANGCDLPEVGGKHTATLAIAPSSSGGYGATLSGDKTTFGVTDADIEYSSNGTNWDKTVPTTTGSYQARIIVKDAADNTKTYTATVSYGVHTITTDKTYTADNDHGTVSVPAAAAANTTVTIETTPAAAFQLESLTVTKAGGETVSVTKDGNNGTFTMPAADVTVSATFVGKNTSLTLSTAGNSGTTCTAKLLDSSYNETSSVTKKAGEEFILCINKDENYSYQASFSSGSAVSMRGFSVDEYKDYLNRTKSESLNTYLYWVTMPGVNDDSVNMTITFATAKTFTILYQPEEGSSTDEVWVKFGYTESNEDKLVTAKMSKDAAMGNVAVWSLKMSAAFNPDKIAFATSEDNAESAATQTATVSTTDSWNTITGTNDKYLIIGNNAKTVIATFTDDSSSANANRDATVISIGDNAEYQIAICASGGSGSVTTPAAPTKAGYDFVAWRGYEGITAKDYAANTQISVKENMAFSAVWQPKNPKVKLNLNGGTGISNAEFTVTYNNNTTLASLTPVKSGSSFAGWSVAKDVTEDGKLYTRGAPFDTGTKITADLELTAQWKHVHAYGCVQIGAVSSLATKYAAYAPYLHIKICGCGDVGLEAHSLDSSGRCVCGYSKSGDTPTNATLDVSYVRQSDNHTMMAELPETVAADSEVSVSAPGKWGNLTFSKWQYRAEGDADWTDAGAYKIMSFVIPGNMKMRALYVNDTQKPEVNLSATTYATTAANMDGEYNSILFQMNYKLPDGYTYVDAGVRSGDNAGISYYELKERTATMDAEAKAIAYSAAAVLSFFSGPQTFDTSGTEQYYAKRENSVLDESEMTAEKLAEYMYQSKPINIKDPPLYWNYKPTVTGQSGSINALTPVGFAQRNDGKHYIYAIAYLTYKDSSGTTHTIYTPALATTLNGISSAGTVSKSGS